MRLRTVGPDDQEYAERHATPEGVHAAFHPAELWYGTEVELLPADSAAPYLNAVAVAGPFADAEDPGEFLLGFAEGGVWYSEATERRFTRHEALGYFLRYLAGDRAWLANYEWAEIRDGKRTGRLHDRAV